MELNSASPCTHLCLYWTSFRYTHPLPLPLKNALISLLDGDAFFVETCTGFAMPVQLKLHWNMYGPTGTMGTLYVLLTFSESLESTTS